MERGQPILFRTDQGTEQWSLTFGALDPTQGFLDLLSRETYLYAHTHVHTHTHTHIHTHTHTISGIFQALQSSCGLEIKQAFSL